MPFARDIFPGIPLVESPLFHDVIGELELSSDERRVALDLHERGYAVIDFPDEQLNERIDRIKGSFANVFDVDMDDADTIKNSGKIQRVQDAWAHNEDIRAIAANCEVRDLLGKIYGRRAFPFQTLNFPVGTEQQLHSDSIHFSSIPERFMCGVWVAMEDILADAGPLTYIPGSHKWPILSNALLGRRGFRTDGASAQAPFEAAWAALVQSSRIEPSVFFARKGEALIWAANLLHGGSRQINPKLTRWSQVTHYFFDDCIYYTPAFSNEPLGLLDLRKVIDIETEELKPNLSLGERIEPEPDLTRPLSLFGRIKKQIKLATLPDDFDCDAYYRLNPDVAFAQIDAARHYLEHGKKEGRRYRFREQRAK